MINIDFLSTRNKLRKMSGLHRIFQTQFIQKDMGKYIAITGSCISCIMYEFSTGCLYTYCQHILLRVTCTCSTIHTHSANTYCFVLRVHAVLYIHILPTRLVSCYVHAPYYMYTYCQRVLLRVTCTRSTIHTLLLHYFVVLTFKFFVFNFHIFMH